MHTTGEGFSWVVVGGIGAFALLVALVFIGGGEVLFRLIGHRVRDTTFASLVGVWLILLMVGIALLLSPWLAEVL